MTLTRRNLNASGQTIANRIEISIGSILFLTTIIYAGVRGQKFATQLPATYRTTTPPSTIPINFVNQIFPSKIPDPTYEFPAITICPEIGSLVGVVSCYLDKSPGNIKVPCDDAGRFSRQLTVSGATVQCFTLNDLPGKAAIASSAQDTLVVTATISGTRPGSPNGAFVTAHPQGGVNATPVMSYDNYFTAGVGTLTQVTSRKVYQIDQHSNVKQTYEVKASSVGLMPDNTTLSGHFALEFQYPKLEVTYEKSFLPLDMVSIYIKSLTMRSMQTSQ